MSLRLWLSGLSLLVGAASALRADAGQEPFADVHVHYKWSQSDVTSPQQAIDTLQHHNVALAVVIGMPARLALQLRERMPERVIAVWSPYRRPDDWARWARDPEVLVRARNALDSGNYRGIGELHLIGGFAPAHDSPVITGLFILAARHRLPILLHTEFSRPDYLVRLCGAHPHTRILWAHAGSILSPAQVDRALRACPNLWTDLSARDPWRFVNNPIADETGTLLPQWQALLERWPERFMVGTDPVWPVDQLDRWDEADSGWQEYGRFIDFHRHWLAQLEPAVARRIRLENALRLFGRTAPRN